MSDTLNVVVIDDAGPELGQVSNNQMTDDITPTVRVSLTTGSGTPIAAGDVIKLSFLGSSAGQVTVTSDDVARGYVDMAAPTNGSLDNQAYGVGAYDNSGAGIASGGISVLLAEGPLVYTKMTDGSYTVSSTSDHNPPFYHAFIQRYDAEHHPVGQVFSGSYESGSPDNYSVTPLAGGSYVALFLDGDHFTDRTGPVVDAHGTVLNTVHTGFNGVATAGTQGGFVLVSEDVGGTGFANIQAFGPDGAAMSNVLSVWNTSTAPFYTLDSDGKIEVNWNDHGQGRVLTMDPLHADSRADPSIAPTITVLDNAGPNTGQVAAGSSTDDTTPTVHIPVNHAGEVYLSFGPSGSQSLLNGTPTQITAADLSRGYLEVDVSKTNGEGWYTVGANYADADGLVGPASGFSFLIRTDEHQGTAGADTEGAQADGAYMTGQGGADVFVFNPAATRDSVITDFTPGTDKLDFSVLFSAYHYRGSDPFADGTITYDSAPFGSETYVYFDPDGAAGPQAKIWEADLLNVSASQLSHSDFIGGPSASPPPPPPPPPSGGQTLQGQPGGSNLQGGAGDDTLIGGSGPDSMTGAGGADHFTWNSLPWSPAQVTDFTHGTDKIDVSGLLSTSHYTGSDPIGDGYVKLIDDGHGDTWLYYDTDGHGTADQWGTFVATLNGVSASSVTDADLVIGGTASPPPPPTSPPPSSGSTLSIGPHPQAYEGTGTNTTFTFTITRTGDTSGAASVSWDVESNGSAPLPPDQPPPQGPRYDGTDTSDFTGPLAGTVNFAPGETSKDITVTVVGDSTPEHDESFKVVLSGASGATISTTPYTYAVILNDDGPVSPPPPPSSGGQTLQGQSGGSNLQGGAGDDTLIGGTGPDSMTGAGGADHFTWNALPWSPGQVTDFAPGTDKIDVSGLLSASHYSGSDPIGDGYVKLIDDGQGDSWLYFDTDGHGTADQWGTFIATLQHVAPGQVTDADLVIGSQTSPPPPTSPPPVSPPPASGGQTLQGQPGGSNLQGGSGDDTLIGGSGPDIMSGAAGADHFVWNALPWSAAHVTDFSHGSDHIDLSHLLASVGYSGSDPIADGYVKLIDDGHGNTWLYFDTDGHGTADQWGTFVATLNGVGAASLSGSDFIFH